MGVLSFIGNVLGALAKLGPLVVSYFAGKRGAEAEQLEEDNDAMETAKRVRDRLRADPDYADRVRERFDG